MALTRISLIQQLSGGDGDAWRQADDIYRPMISQWLIRFGLQPADCQDLTQEVMLTLSREILRFEHRGRLGAFRNWLKTITVNRARVFFRQRRIRPTAPGGSAFLSMLDDLVDQSSEISQLFDRTHDAFVVRQMMQEISGEFAEQTVTAFRRHVIEGRDAAAVADELGVSRWNIYQAKSRVLRRLRECAGLWAEEIELKHSLVERP